MGLAIILILFTAALSGSVFAVGYKRQNTRWIHFSYIVAIGFVVHLAATLITDGHPTDMNCFKSWANTLFEVGPSNFYKSGGFTDYPPGYMYVLYVIGMIRKLFNIDYGTYTYSLLIKLPAIIADILSGIFLYKIASTKTSDKTALFVAFLYVLNPVVILNSSVWGQVDSIHTLVLVAAVFYLTEVKILPASLLFIVGIIIKPQSFMYAPVYMYAFYRYLSERKFSGKAFLDLVKYAAICVVLAFALILPFASYDRGFPDLSPVIDQYINTLGSYNYTTVNAYNIYGLFHLNWVDANTLFLGIPYTVWGTAALVVIVIFALFFINQNNSKSNYFFTSALLTMCTFMFSIKMHERYCFPALLFLLAAYIYRRNKYILYMFFAYTIAFFIHYVDVLAMSINNYNYAQIDVTMVYFSFLMTAAFIFMMIKCFSVYKKGSKDGYDKNADIDDVIDKIKKAVKVKEKEDVDYVKSGERVRFTRHDAIFLAVIVVVYSIVAFAKLGDMTAAQNPWVAKTGDNAVIDFGETITLSRMQYMPNAKHDQQFTVEFSTDGINFGYAVNITKNDVFDWKDEQIPYEARYAKVTVETNEFRINEMAFRDADGGLVAIAGISGTPGAELLFDEQEFVPFSNNYTNSTYFDEIYHPRTAYEFNNSLYVYEWTHPPLGKLIISVGISMFGMTPFGWRFMGTLFGVLMLPAIFVFGKKMFKDTKWAAFAATIFAFDFMHYAQTRLATIDTYITFFVILMYMFMFYYMSLNYNDPETKLKKTLLPLALSGICMGFGIACKWPGMYAGIGLAVLFFAHIGGRIAEFAKARKNPHEGNLHIRLTFQTNTALTLLWCVLFFVLVPAGIYLASYIPYYFGDHQFYQVRGTIGFLNSNPSLAKFFPDKPFGNFVAAVIQNQLDMFNYHSKLVSTHPFSSEWWKWPLNIRPIFYFSNTVTEDVKQGISAFGNPLVWVGGFIAFLISIYHAAVRRNKEAVFLIIAYLAQIVPWMLVPRTTYIYHYFPNVPFLVLLTALVFKESFKKTMIPAYVFAVLTVLLFIMFYPVLTGIPVSVKYVDYILRWLPSWQFL